MSEVHKQLSDVTYKLGYVCAILGVSGDESLDTIKAHVRERLVDAGVAASYKQDNARLRKEVAAHEERIAALFAWAKLESRLDAEHATLEQLLQDAVARARENFGQ